MPDRDITLRGPRMKAKLTDWYPAEVRPVRVGVYEIEAPHPPWFRFWDGSEWSVGARTPEQVNPYALMYTPPFQRWRGLSRDPKGA